MSEQNQRESLAGPEPNADSAVGLVLQVLAPTAFILTVLLPAFQASKSVELNGTSIDLGGSAAGASDVLLIVTALIACLLFVGGLEVRSSGKRGFYVLLFTGALLCLMGGGHAVLGALLVVYCFLRLNGRFGPVPH